MQLKPSEAVFFKAKVNQKGPCQQFGGKQSLQKGFDKRLGDNRNFPCKMAANYLPCQMEMRMEGA